MGKGEDARNLVSYVRTYVSIWTSARPRSRTLKVPPRVTWVPVHGHDIEAFPSGGTLGEQKVPCHFYFYQRLQYDEVPSTDGLAGSVHVAPESIDLGAEIDTRWVSYSAWPWAWHNSQPPALCCTALLQFIVVGQNFFLFTWFVLLIR